MDFIALIKNKVFNGHERSVKAKKNIIAMFAIQGYNIAINLAIIPITLHLLSDYKYGVWITLFNMLSWISIFDIGIGNGLRNKFAEFMAEGDLQTVREYLSTAYGLMGLITISLIVLFIIPWLLIDWSWVFNVRSDLSFDIFLLIGISFALTSIQFTLKLILTVFTASHKPAIGSFVMSISNTLILIVFLLAGNILDGSLVGIGVVYSVVPLLVLFVASVAMFRGSFKNIRPEIKYFKREKVKSLFSLGLQFFIIQIAVIVIFQTDSMIISHAISPAEVTPYNIVFRYFGIVTMFFGIIMTPFWSAYTEAAAKNDYLWIKASLKKQLKLFGASIIFILGIFFIARPVITFWMQREIPMTNNLLIGMAIYVVVSVWNTIFSSLLGGLSKIRLGTFVTMFTALLNIPLSLFFVRWMNYDSGGVIYATVICLGITAVISPLQIYYFLYSNKKTNFLTNLLR
jgi:O-antigen/teichoic acid export membrane protein